MTTHLAPAPCRSLRSRLDREWLAIRSRPSVLRRAAGWGLDIAFHSLDDIVAATGFWASSAEREAAERETTERAATEREAAELEEAGSAGGNAVLRRLLLVARTDDLAARVVLQRLLPGLATRAYRWGARRAGGSADAFDELVSAAWTVIREFPVERRPRHLAANLLRDSEYHAFVRATRRRLVPELTDPFLLDLPVGAPPAIEPADELADVIACARSLSEYDLRLIELLAQGRTAKEVASAMHISERSVRNHRDLVVHRLRVAAAA